METRTIEQTVEFSASAQEIFDLIMDSAKHSEVTGAPASISREIGGEWTAMGGGLNGKLLDLVENEKIVQSWRAQDWPEGHHSTATFELSAARGGGTVLDFTQTDVPSENYDSIHEGWSTYYWDKMKKHLGE